MYNINRGILFIILSAFGFATMSLFIQLAGDIPVIQKCLFRNIVALMVAFFVLVKNGEDFSIDKGDFKFLFLRSLVGTIGIFCNFYAVQNMILADASMINRLTPFFVIIFSCFVIKERVALWQISCVIAAFIGAVFIINPQIIASLLGGVYISSKLNSAAAMVGVLGAMAAGLAYTTLRLLAIRGVKGPFIVFFFSAFSTLACLPFVVTNYVPMTSYQWFCLLATGVFASLGQFAVTAAYANAPAREISIYDYTQIIFAAIYGFVIFGQTPVIYSLIGYLFIVIVAIYMFKRGKQENH